MSTLSLRLFCPEPFRAQAEDYAPWCTVTISPAPPEPTCPALWLDAGGLGLLMPGFAKPYRPAQAGPVHRQRSHASDPMVRACAAGRGNISVLDACAGFGSDGLVMSDLGCRVTYLERDPLIWLLLRDRVKDLPGAWAHCADAQDFMAEGDRWDVVYLDPMFPLRNKTALPGLGMQHLRTLSEATSEEVDMQQALADLLQSARRAAIRRVVCKRRAKDPTPDSLLTPDFQVKGKMVRFDVYLTS